MIRYITALSVILGLAAFPVLVVTGQTIPTPLHLPLIRYDSTPTPTATPSPTATATATETPTPSPTATATATETPTITPPTPTPTDTPIPTGGDLEPPQLSSWSFAPTSVDTSDSDQIITFTAHFTDNLSGVRSTFASFRSPSGQQDAGVSFTIRDLISGTPQDGIYQETMTLPRFCETGTWQLDYFYLWDEVGNRRRLTRASVAALGLPVSFVVTE